MPLKDIVYFRHQASEEPLSYGPIWKSLAVHGGVHHHMNLRLTNRIIGDIYHEKGPWVLVVPVSVEKFHVLCRLQEVWGRREIISQCRLLWGVWVWVWLGGWGCMSWGRH